MLNQDQNPPKSQRGSKNELFPGPLLLGAPPLVGLLFPLISRIAPPCVAWPLTAGLDTVFAAIGAAANAAGDSIIPAIAAIMIVFIGLPPSLAIRPSRDADGTAPRLVPDHACAKNAVCTEKWKQTRDFGIRQMPYFDAGQALIAATWLADGLRKTCLAPACRQ
ncbi:hypothetical protein SLT36_22170 [Aminobacter sp. BA135]|uniref:hypothetical protein n=1 Tax=Aminobacter sp. BA135 TaxID=537596 RepID=UPI003D79D8A2